MISSPRPYNIFDALVVVGEAVSVVPFTVPVAPADRVADAVMLPSPAPLLFLTVGNVALPTIGSIAGS